MLDVATALGKVMGVQLQVRVMLRRGQGRAALGEGGKGVALAAPGEGDGRAALGGLGRDLSLALKGLWS